MKLRCTLHSQNRTDVLTMAGDVDMDGSDELRRMTDALGAVGRSLRVDLSEVTFMDSTGAHFLVALRRRSEASGTALVLVGMRSGPARMLRLLGLTGFRIEQPQPCKVDG